MDCCNLHHGTLFVYCHQAGSQYFNSLNSPINLLDTPHHEFSFRSNDKLHEYFFDLISLTFVALFSLTIHVMLWISLSYITFVIYTMSFHIFPFRSPYVHLYMSNYTDYLPVSFVSVKKPFEKMLSITKGCTKFTFWCFAESRQRFHHSILLVCLMKTKLKHGISLPHNLP